MKRWVPFPIRLGARLPQQSISSCRSRTTGEWLLLPEPAVFLPPRRIEAYRDVIPTAIERRTDITLVEMAEMLRVEHGASFATSTIWRFLGRHAMTVKKTAHANEQARPDVAARR